MFERLKSWLSPRRNLSPLEEAIATKRQQVELKLLESQLSFWDQFVDPLDWPWVDTPDFYGFPGGPTA